MHGEEIRVNQSTLEGGEEEEEEEEEGRRGSAVVSSESIQGETGNSHLRENKRNPLEPLSLK